MPSRSIMIAVGGDSGAGKTTMCYGLDLIFGSDRIATLCLDDYHSLDRIQRKAVGLTALNPRANNFAAMEEDLWSLREGRSIDKPVYDHSDGTLKGPERFEPKELIVIQGLFPLYTRTLRSLFDVTVWLDPEPELKVTWKIQRDTMRRGYTEHEVREEIDKRQPDIEAYIQPQAKYADLSVQFYRPENWESHRDCTRLNARISKGRRFKPLDYSDIANSSNAMRQRTVPTDGGVTTIVELDGHVDDGTALAMEDRVWSSMETHAHLRPERLGQFYDRTGLRHSHTLALAQLLIARRVALVENELLQVAG